jgi:ABC-type nickel/cobalt efflux system permease component RcnA
MNVTDGWLPSLTFTFGASPLMNAKYSLARMVFGSSALAFFGLAAWVFVATLLSIGRPQETDLRIPPWWVGVALAFLVAAVGCLFAWRWRYWNRMARRVQARDQGEFSQHAEPAAAPNGGPATPVGDSGVTEGPPSVS